ncbi:hypothetical protein BC629DRAFT_1582924 [Irpex lacteus]|nr:hypothetical protein BC629DRAFT_1582924 [Irpex lacteus]
MASPTPSPSNAQSGGSGSGSASAPAGLLTITQPPQTATSYYKIATGETITFAWNTSYVLVHPLPSHFPPSATTVNIPCGPSDGHIPGTATSVQWDLWSYQQNNPQTPLANRYQGPGVQRSPGVLSENNQLQFAMYSPQAYTPLINWTCPQCNTNGSLSDYASHPAFLSLIVTVLVMFMSGWQLLRTIDH